VRSCCSRSRRSTLAKPRSRSTGATSSPNRAPAPSYGGVASPLDREDRPLRPRETDRHREAHDQVAAEAPHTGRVPNAERLPNAHVAVPTPPP
jgi:hypothetical protein